MQDDIEGVQVKLAFQEEAISEMSDEIARQQQEIGQLQNELQQLRRELRAITDSPVRLESEESPPPHY
ncbi:MAG: SlyX family protein [Granulosicoccaceae bacterium]|jgi:SlyX protein